MPRAIPDRGWCPRGPYVSGYVIFRRAGAYRIHDLEAITVAMMIDDLSANALYTLVRATMPVTLHLPKNSMSPLNL